jgi:hypothetical protein
VGHSLLGGIFFDEALEIFGDDGNGGFAEV